MNLNELTTINPLLKKHGFNFSKGLGQNFLIDSFVCPEMSTLCGANKDYGILEIGPGIGVLTKELCQTAKKVVAVEIDKRLIPILDETLSEYDNVKIITGDILKLDLKTLLESEFKGMPVVVCANLPYYITSPVVMHLLESQLPLESVTVMIQKETAERFTAPVGSRTSGAITVSIHYYAEAEYLFDVGRECFFPSPNVDSAVIKLTLRKEPPVFVTDKRILMRLIKAAFSQRRKTIYNSISSSVNVDKQKLSEIFEICGIDRSLRAENLSLKNFADIANRL